MVRYPKSSITPLDFFIEKSGNFQLITSLKNIWHSNAGLPENSTDGVPDLNIVETSNLSGSVGAKALFDIFNIGFNTSFLRDNSIRIKVINPERTYCDFAQAINFVTKGDLKEGEGVGDYFLDEKMKIHLIVEVISSSEIQIEIKSKKKSDASLIAEELTDTVNASIKGGSVKSSNNIISYSRDEKVVFGFKSAEIYYKENSWKLDLPTVDRRKFLGAASGQESITPLVQDQRLIFE